MKKCSKIKKTLLHLLLAFAPFNPLVICAEDSSEIRVHLETQSPLSPLYMGKWLSENTALSPSYIRQLEEILQFDLSYNGCSRVLPQNEQKEEMLRQNDEKNAFKATAWKNWGIPHVIKVVAIDKKLTVDLFSTQSGSLKHINEIVLSGDLGRDRRQIHKIADAIQKALFDKGGVASSRLLYCVQVKNARSDGTQWISEIWECDWDGANAHQVTKENSYSVTPVFVPSHPQITSNRFLYVSYKLGQPKIYIASIKEGAGKRLIDLKGNQLLPAISPQRDKIAYISDASGRTDLFIQSFHPDRGELGKPVQLFSYPRSTQASPTFSPDGSKIAFVSDKDGAPRIYVIPSKPSHKRAPGLLITKRCPESSCPSWSPDGTKLAYSAKTNGIRQIWIYDFALKEERQLTDGPGNKENPAWAPDSLHLVFNSTDTSSSELYLVNLNQPEAIKITRGPGKKHYPSWGNR